MMSLTKDVQILSNIPLFAKVNPAKLKLLAFTSERLEYSQAMSCFTRMTTATLPTSSLRVRPTSWSTLLTV